MSLENAAPEVKLAVDLIMLLETNHVEPEIVLAALDIVRRDYQQKTQHKEDNMAR
ncbi:pleiotropic regulatory protein RsmS [Pectobacteriaceae bacterium CE90]|nr:pleiotropic regulatory protein RsmS [Prodigiosinella sp. LS101]WJV55087.1 pleiotropic regulatory protein RsmS [Prodigiosinella sp. LS101]WJV59446.1 pleiotropic regulatory protein RsmS [Pectobacteriaceae bacterium C111]WJY14022.1 pleiotropic regulatory protein RsmS [Pectobacteriaceae bacterium CE90]